MFPEKAWLTLEELATRWDVSIETVEHYLLSGKLKASALMPTIESGNGIFGGCCQIKDYLQYYGYKQRPLGCFVTFISNNEEFHVSGGEILGAGGIKEEGIIILTNEIIRFEQEHDIMISEFPREQKKSSSDEEPVPPYLDPEHDYYSEELAATIMAWQYAVEKKPRKNDFKAIVQARLKSLSDLSGSAKERIATTANCHKNGGRRSQK
jgi:hypothetical protein